MAPRFERSYSPAARLSFSLVVLLLATPNCYPQSASLLLSSGAAAPGATVTLPLTITVAGVQPAALQWSIAWSAKDVSGVAFAEGPAAVASGKTLACKAQAGRIVCLLTGINSNAIANGVVAIATIQLSPSPGAAVALTVGTVIASSIAGQSLPITGTGGTVSVAALPSVTVTPATAVATASQNTGQVSVGCLSSGCTWTASSDAAWLQVFPLSGTGSGQIHYTVFPNFSTLPRAGTVTIGTQRFTVTQQPGSGTADERFIKLLYFNFFGRLPADPEIAFQLGSNLTRAQLAYNFLNSMEFNRAGRFVAGLYVGLLNRDAEYGGWLFQRNALSGAFTNTDSLIANFVGSAEFIAKNGELFNAAYVSLLYRQILGRVPSGPEIAFQASVLDGGGSRIVMARTFLEGNEFLQGKYARLLSFLLSATLLNRDPSFGEYISRHDRIAASPTDATLRAIIGEIVDSSDFKSQFN